jgi:putative peptidoglycan lipid II flippase
VQGRKSADCGRTRRRNERPKEGEPGADLSENRTGPDRPMRRGATHVALAVSLSRVAGLIRERIFAQYLGTSDAADAFGAALRIPMLMDSVFGDRVMSSAFIPRYSRLLAAGPRGESTRLAWAVASIQALLVAVVVLAGVVLAPVLVAWIAPGFGEEKSALTIRLVRILFPAIGLLALGSWCLGVLTSHRRFFLPYIVPILSAASISVAVIQAGSGRARPDIAVAAAWGALAGAALQVLAQLPWVVRALGRRPARRAGSGEDLREVGRNAIPATARGLVGRLGTWVEVAIAGFISTGALAGLNYAQLLYSLPVGLFTVAISAAMLPELSAATANSGTVVPRLAGALDAALRHTAWLLVACAVAFIALGDVITAAVYQGGHFTSDDVVYVWVILAASSFGLVGSSMGGLHATAFYAIGDAKTPLKSALFRLGARALLGVLLAIPLVRVLGLEPKWGAAGLGAAIGISGWIEFLLLRRWLDERLGIVRSPHFVPYLVTLWLIAGLAAGIAWVVRIAIPTEEPITRAAAVLGTYGVAYLGVSLIAGLREPRTLLSQLHSFIRN